MAQEDRIGLDLTADEALVLFEWLARFNEKKDTGAFESAAEQQVLWHLEARLERVLIEPFKPNYSELLAAARNRVCGAE